MRRRALSLELQHLVNEPERAPYTRQLALESAQPRNGTARQRSRAARPNDAEVSRLREELNLASSATTTKDA
jgi:hypothetical protein